MGVASIGITAYQYSTGEISGSEALVDVVFGVIGLTGVGAPISFVYFAGKFIYEVALGNILFNKPKQQPLD